MSEDTEFNGTLKFEKTLKIDGRFKGELSTGGLLLVGKTGKVEAELKR